MSASSYLLGTLEIAAILTAAALGAHRVRLKLAPELKGLPGALATTLVTVFGLLGVAELLGTFGLLKEQLYIPAILGVGGALWWLLRPEGRASGLPSERLPVVAVVAEEGGPASSSPALNWAAIALTAIAVAHFTIGLRLRLSTGMTGFDSTWYHGPFAAGFAQTGHTFDLQLIAPQFLAWFYPQNSELLHGVGDLVYGRDILSPLVNLVWLLGCLAAAWALGRPFGAAPVSMAGVALVVNTGMLADQAGEARNDLAGAFFLLAALAILVNATGGMRPIRPALGAVAICSLGAGLAAGTKVNFLLPAIVLAAALFWLAATRTARPWLTAGVTVGAAVAGGGYWYLRNLAHAGNPVPQIRGIGLPAPGQPLGGREGHSVLSYATDWGVWADWFGPGLHSSLGLLWPLIALLALAGAAACLERRAEPALRVAALVALAAAATWLVAPTSASGPDGMPRGFESGLRYLAPALLLGAALLPLAPALRSERARRALLVAIAVAFPFADRSAGGWATGYLPVAILAGLFFGALVLAATSERRPRPSARVAVAALAGVVVLGALAGYPLQRTYLKNRYADPQFTVAGLDRAFGWAQPISGARIATTTTRTYPLLGRDLSNRVRFIGLERPHGGYVATSSCREWLTQLRDGDYDYVVASLDRSIGGDRFPPQAAWTAADPSARVVFREAPTVVFRLDGRPDPASCAATS